MVALSALEQAMQPYFLRSRTMSDYMCPVLMSHMMLPNIANPDGNVHGGDIMKLIDNAAAVVAMKYARTAVCAPTAVSIIWPTTRIRSRCLHIRSNPLWASW